jgi:hypothetical protein
MQETWAHMYLRRAQNWGTENAPWRWTLAVCRNVCIRREQEQCSSASQGGTMRDSAGVTFLEHGPAAQLDLSRWMVSESPVVTVGSPNSAPGEELFRVARAVRRSDGAIVVANAGTSDLRVYGRDGRLRSRSGREGDGPGEFRSVGGLVRLGGDSLMVWDYRAMQVSVYDENVDLVRTVNLAGQGTGLPLPVGALPGGRWLLLSISMPAARGNGVLQDTAALLVYDVEGRAIAELGRVPFRDVYQGRTESGPTVSVEGLLVHVVP